MATNTRSGSLPVLSGVQDLPYTIVAHNELVQDRIDQYGLSWSKQYELARGVSDRRWKWEDVTRERIEQLAIALPPRHAEQVMGKQSSYEGKSDIWEELDREQKALEEGRGRGLGLTPNARHDQANWYGGRVQQTIYLREVLNGFYLELGPLRMVGRSNRIARFVGSRRLLQIKLPEKAAYQQDRVRQLHLLLSRKFVLCGRVFIPFAIKDGKAHLIETNEDYERVARPDQGDSLRMSFVEFIEWYNPLYLNQRQNLCKYAARIDLGLSNSIPVLEFKPENFFRIPDECAAHPSNDVPTEKIFTDGCGYVNVAALLAVGRAMCFTSPPTAIQGRILGAKGVWLLHPTDRDPLAEPRIWIRPSQIKVHLVPDDDFTKNTVSEIHRAHRIFDLLVPSRTTTPSRLSRLTIMNLHYNGVPEGVFTTLLRDGLQKEVQALTQWEGLSAMPLLWNAINKAAGVGVQRLQRSAAGLQRVLGISRKRDEQYSDDDDFLGTPSAPQNPTGPAKPAPTLVADESPPTIGEVILDLVQAGFNPKKNNFLHKELRQLIKNVTDAYIKEYHIIVPQSLEAFIVPDPFGVLEEDEIHFRSSQDVVEGCLYLDPKAIAGDVLIYRNPARVPSDVQKVRAVQRPELSPYVDVIILPTKGKRSLASLLAGGDVDGDTAVIIFDPAIVEKFNPPPITAEPSNLANNFESQEAIPKVSQVVQEMTASPDRATNILQTYLLVGLSDFDKKGMYSRFHEYAVYNFGYNHPYTVSMAYMFTTVLDSRKSGLVVKPAAFRDHKGRFNGQLPPCLGGKGGIHQVDDQTFILETLLDVGAAIQGDMLRQYDILAHKDNERDDDLLRPWQDISSLNVPEIANALAALKGFVDTCRRDWGEIFRKYRDTLKDVDKRTADRIVKRSKHELAVRFATEVPQECALLRTLGVIHKVKASYAYSLGANFAHSIAWQALCNIKADAKGSKAFTAELGNTMTVPSAEVRMRMLLNAASTSTIPTPYA